MQSAPDKTQGEPRTSRANTSSQLIKICDRIEQKGAEPNYSCVPSARSVTLEIILCGAPPPPPGGRAGRRFLGRNTKSSRKHGEGPPRATYEVRVVPCTPPLRALAPRPRIYLLHDVVEYLRNLKSMVMPWGQWATTRKSASRNQRGEHVLDGQDVALDRGQLLAHRDTLLALAAQRRKHRTLVIVAVRRRLVHLLD